jgi:hypothetical protein
VTAALVRSADFALRAAEADQPLRFGESVAADLRLIRLLRDATSHAVRLAWRLSGVPSLDLRDLVHLIPPVDGVDAAARAYAAEWIDAHRYGSYYYRRGPGFVTVRDVRAGGKKQRLLIDQGSAEFLEMAEAAHADELSPAARRALPDAVDAGLAVLADDSTMVLLPHRMRHWPVAYTKG